MSFADSPDFDARAAAVLWHPEHCPSILPLITHPANNIPQREVFRLSELRCRTLVLQATGNLQHVLVRDNARCLQLVVSGTDVLRPVHLVTEALVGRKRIRSHLSALRCLNDLHTSGQLLERHFPPEPRGQRLALVLQALDGRLAGASHREVAAVLFGRSRVESNWTDPGNYLRDRTRRAIRRGWALMSGGYLAFLD